MQPLSSKNLHSSSPSQNQPSPSIAQWNGFTVKHIDIDEVLPSHLHQHAQKINTFVDAVRRLGGAETIERIEMRENSRKEFVILAHMEGEEKPKNLAKLDAISSFSQLLLEVSKSLGGGQFSIHLEKSTSPTKGESNKRELSPRSKEAHAPASSRQKLEPKHSAALEAYKSHHSQLSEQESFAVEILEMTLKQLPSTLKICERINRREEKRTPWKDLKEIFQKAEREPSVDLSASKRASHLKRIVTFDETKALTVEDSRQMCEQASLILNADASDLDIACWALTEKEDSYRAVYQFP